MLFPSLSNTCSPQSWGLSKKRGIKTQQDLLGPSQVQMPFLVPSFLFVERRFSSSLTFLEFQRTYSNNNYLGQLAHVEINNSVVMGQCPASSTRKAHNSACHGELLYSGESRSHGAAAAPCGVEGPKGPYGTFMITNPVRDTSTLTTEAPPKSPNLLMPHVRR